jgi:parvulin-like peptidyl-prolyl isomerase
MRRFFLVLLALPFALLAIGCGGGGGGSAVSSGDVAVVDGEHISQETLDHRMTETACRYQLQKRPFPKAGSTEYQNLQKQVVQTLVQRVQLDQKAPSLKVTVTDKQVEGQLDNLKKQYFGGSEKKYKAELKKQCVTDAEVRDDIRANLLSNGIYKKLTAGVSVTPAEVTAYYDGHREVYTTPQTRVVSHILVKNKALADKLYAQLKAGADFATLAKKYSEDPGSKSQGGQLTISRGQTVPEFDKEAFSLKTGELSKPVKTQFGWHIIRAEKDATKSKTTPFPQVKAAIKQQLIQQKRSESLQKWLEGVKKEFESKISYATGLAPPATTSATTTTG